MLTLKIKKLHPDARVPRRWSSDAVGFDLCAFQLTDYGKPNRRVVGPNSTIRASTGLAIELPKTHFALLIPRPELTKFSISITDSPTLIDPGFNGELSIAIYNGSYVPFYVEHEMRIAHLIILPAIQVTFKIVDDQIERDLLHASKHHPS